MTVEPHPYPERALWRVGLPVAAAVLAVVGFVVMLGVSPGPPTVVLVVVLLAQIALQVARGVALRRAARVADRLVYCHQFFFAWSFFAGVTYLFERGDLPLAGALHIVLGLFFAVLLVGAFVLMNRKTRPRGDGPTG